MPEHKQTNHGWLISPDANMGSFYYISAAEGRRPCKICNPVPGLNLPPLNSKPYTKPKASEFRPPVSQPNPLIEVKMLTGEIAETTPGRILGWCHFKDHPGAINKAIMTEHDCLGKGCKYFERNDQSPYWEQLENKKKAKAERKNKLREEKIQKEVQEDTLRILADCWQEYLNDIGSDMYIVRIAQESLWEYKVFYVSDNRFDDGNRYTAFRNILGLVHPRYRVRLCHIKDVDGHFVTRDEYRSRVRK